MCHISVLKTYFDLVQFLQLFLAFLNANKAYFIVIYQLVKVESENISETRPLLIYEVLGSC